MKTRFNSLFLAAAALGSVALAQTQPGSANTVDPYAPTTVKSSTTSTPPVDPGTDTPATTPVSTQVAVNAARLAKLDTDKDGRISLSEFTAGYTEKSVASSHAGGMQSGTRDAAVAFKQLDADNDSYLSATELAAADANRPNK